jgi:hypothetical protein
MRRAIEEADTVSEVPKEEEAPLTIDESLAAEGHRGGFLHQVRARWRHATLRSGRPRPGVYDEKALEGGERLRRHG